MKQLIYIILLLLLTNKEAITTEQHYFNKKCHDIYRNKRLAKLDSQDLMSLMQKIQFKYNEKENFPLFRKLNLKVEYGIGSIAFWRTKPEKVLETIKATYYSVKLKELDSKLQRNRASHTARSNFGHSFVHFNKEKY